MNYREAEAALVAAHRRANPRSRAPGIVVYFKNTAKVRQQWCVLCHRAGPTWCGDWPKTKRAEKWAEDHTDLHVFKLLETANAAPS